MTEWIVTSCTLILIVVGLRFLLKGRISMSLQYGLWILVLLRLLIPVSIGSPFSVMNLLPQPIPADNPTHTASASLPEFSLPPAAASQPVSEQHRLENYQSDPVQPLEGTTAVTPKPVNTKQVLLLIWGVGTALFACLLIGIHLHFSAKLRRSRVALSHPDSPVPLYRTTCVQTPCLFGCFSPAIYLPPAYDTEETRQYVLCHELTHYRHGDPVWAALRCVCLALHWYNPLVWVAAVLSKQDAELACDAAVIRKLGDNQRSSYGKLLIEMSQVSKNVPPLLLSSTTMLTTKQSLKERITMIVRRPKTALATLLCVILIIAAAIGCTFTGADTSDPGPKPLLDFQQEELIYIRQKGGFGSDFIITLYQNGEFKYTEGNLSSYFGYGNWQLEDSTLILEDGSFHNEFLVTEDSLIWMAAKSTGFTYGALISLTDGDAFSLLDREPPKLQHIAQLSYFPEDYLGGGPPAAFVHVANVTYVWDYQVVGYLDGLFPVVVGTVEGCDNTVIPTEHLRACRIPAGTTLYMGKDAGNSKYDAIYYKLQGQLLYARLLPVDAYKNSRWWETLTTFDSTQVLSLRTLREVCEKKGKFLSPKDFSVRNSLTLGDENNHILYHLYNVEGGYRLMLVCGDVHADVEALQARFYHIDRPEYWIDLMTTELDLYWQTTAAFSPTPTENGDSLVNELQSAIYIIDNQTGELVASTEENIPEWFVAKVYDALTGKEGR